MYLNLRHCFQIRGHLEFRSGGFLHVFHSLAFCDFHESETLGAVYVEDAFFGDDHVDALFTGEGEVALFKDFGAAVFGCVFHADDDFGSWGCYQIHCAAHAFDKFFLE